MTLFNIALSFPFPGNGEVDFEEFLTLMKKQIKHMDPEDELKELFQIYDINSDGLIR
jgi:calmodulin